MQAEASLFKPNFIISNQGHFEKLYEGVVYRLPSALNDVEVREFYWLRRARCVARARFVCREKMKDRRCVSAPSRFGQELFSKTVY